jgi:hypothetical protein
MYEEGRPDENFQAPTENAEESQDNFQPLAEISYDDPRVRSIIDEEGVTAEEAIMRVRAEQAAKDREAEE